MTGLVNFNAFNVDAGPGNDLVDSSALPISSYLVAVLGDGADTFVGGAGDDRVAAGAAGFIWVDVPSESERDVIDTGDGSDSVVSGGPGLANDDEVRTGNGDDNVTWSGTMGPQGVLDAGAGLDLLLARASGQTFGIDMAAQKLGRNGVVEASFSAFEKLRVVPEPDLGTVDIIGTDGDDVVELHAPAAVRASLGAGDDLLRVAATKPGSNIDLGSGIDTVRAVSMEGSAGLDLGGRVMYMDAYAAVPLLGVENGYVSARQAIVKGDSRANTLVAVGCFATVNGRAGNDTIEHTNYDFETDTGYNCAGSGTTLIGGSGEDQIEGGKHADRIYGGAGNDHIDTGPALRGKNRAWGGAGNDNIQGGGDKDVLSGGAGNDTLGGKTGRDVAIGGPDRDRCRAEVEKSCER